MFREWSPASEENHEVNLRNLFSCKSKPLLQQNLHFVKINLRPQNVQGEQASKLLGQLLSI